MKGVLQELPWRVAILRCPQISADMYYGNVTLWLEENTAIIGLRTNIIAHSWVGINSRINFDSAASVCLDESFYCSVFINCSRPSANITGGDDERMMRLSGCCCTFIASSHGTSERHRSYLAPCNPFPRSGNAHLKSRSSRVVSF
jgi:hypothetical protein